MGAKKAAKTRANCERTFAAVDLFSGCGGLSLGLRRAGFSVRAAVEIEEKAQATYRLNHPEVRLYGKDIRKLSVRSVLADLGLRVGQLDLLAGCPPCQGFSRLRTRNRETTVVDPRNDLVEDFLRFVRVMKPKTVMLENVPGLERDIRFSNLIETLNRLGYVTLVRVLNAADFGVAQRRRRLILLASRVHLPTLGRMSNRSLTVRDVFAALKCSSARKDSLHAIDEKRSAAVERLIRLIPRDGGSRTDLPVRYRLACHVRSDGFRDVYGRMAWSEVAPTITSGCVNPSKGRFLHPTRDRAITLREAALLQGFPRTYKFDVKHGKEAIALMIGNALPPPFIAAHARALRNGIRQHRTYKRGTRARAPFSE
jgi:DNA (cytosine-5)-methyltransferase 1